MSRIIRPVKQFARTLFTSSTYQSRVTVQELPELSVQQTLEIYPPTQVTQLDNGMRVATEQSDQSIATVGMWINAGSRYETEENNGVAHFLEHMLLKGTNKRSDTDLELEVRNLGAHLNAYTTREKSVFYGTCFSNDVPKMVDILSDVLQNSKLDEKAIEAEKVTILNELEALENNWKEVMLNHLHSVAYQGTNYGKSVIGSTDSITNMRNYDLNTYLKDYILQPGNIVLVGSGGIDHDSLVKLAEQHFGHLKIVVSDSVTSRVSSRYTGSDVRIKDDTMPLRYSALAVEGVSYNHHNYWPLRIAQTLVGSFDRTHSANVHNSFALPRYCHDLPLAHSYEAFFIPYEETGLWGIYSVCENHDSSEVFVYNIAAEWKRLSTNPKEFEVEKAKNTLRTAIYRELSTGTEAICEDIGTQMLRHGARTSLSTLDTFIKSITAPQVKEACFNQIYNRCPVAAAHGPFDITYDYSRIRSSLYWLKL